MLTSFAATRSFTLGVERGLSLDTQDPGCWTGNVVGIGDHIGSNLGITAADLCRWLQRPATAAEMAGLDSATQAAIFGAWFWNVVAANGLPVGIDLSVTDHGYLRGAQTSAMVLQRLAGVTPDGHVGAVTLTAVSRVTPAALLDRIAHVDATELQVALGVTADGEIGPATRAAMMRLQPVPALLAMLQAAQVADCRTAADAARYIEGWTTRARSRRLAGVRLAATGAEV